MNPGQEQFFNFFMERVIEGKEEEARELLKAGFEKQAEGTFDAAYLNEVMPRYFELIQPKFFEDIQVQCHTLAQILNNIEASCGRNRQRQLAIRNCKEGPTPEWVGLSFFYRGFPDFLQVKQM